MRELSTEERDIALGALWRFATGELSPAELDVELERWLQEVALLKADLAAGDVLENDEATTRGGIAYAELRLTQITRQMERFTRAGLHQRRELKDDFQAAKYVDLVGLAETLGLQPRKAGHNYVMRCPFHEGDRDPSFVIYPPGRGWHCFGCGKSGDAAGFCAEYFHCSQLEGLRWVRQLAEGVGAAS